jgi:hypothetical protein
MKCMKAGLPVAGGQQIAGFIPKDGELLVWAFPKVNHYRSGQQAQCVSGSRGFSVRIMRGLWWREGNYRGRRESRAAISSWPGIADSHQPRLFLPWSLRFNANSVQSHHQHRSLQRWCSGTYGLRTKRHATCSTTLWQKTQGSCIELFDSLAATTTLRLINCQ